MNKAISFFTLLQLIWSCTNNDNSYESITNDPIFKSYYDAFLESSDYALIADHDQIDKELKSCGLYNNHSSVCDPVPECNLSEGTLKWFNLSCNVYQSTRKVQIKYDLTDDEFKQVISQYISENYEQNTFKTKCFVMIFSSTLVVTLLSGVYSRVKFPSLQPYTSE